MIGKNYYDSKREEQLKKLRDSAGLNKRVRPNILKLNIKLVSHSSRGNRAASVKTQMLAALGKMDYGDGYTVTVNPYSEVAPIILHYDKEEWRMSLGVTEIAQYLEGLVRLGLTRMEFTLWKLS